MLFSIHSYCMEAKNIMLDTFLDTETDMQNYQLLNANFALIYVIHCEFTLNSKKSINNLRTLKAFIYIL